jgi:hypothetical protein
MHVLFNDPASDTNYAASKDTTSNEWRIKLDAIGSSHELFLVTVSEFIATD